MDTIVKERLTLQTNLAGRLKNTHLSPTQGLMPLFEAVINSIHSIEDAFDDLSRGIVCVEVVRSNQHHLEMEEANKPKREITGFIIRDNGIGFNKENLQSFNTLDTDRNAYKGCRGVGRLLWLKAFKKAKISSVYLKDNVHWRAEFIFDAKRGLHEFGERQDKNASRETTIELVDFGEKYRKVTHKSADSIARDILEHCLWYFVRGGTVPRIVLQDDRAEFSLHDMYEQCIHGDAKIEDVDICGKHFTLMHFKFRASSKKHNVIAFCADQRLVAEKNPKDIIPELPKDKELADEDGCFFYACYVESKFLDETVRSERTSFDIGEQPIGLLKDVIITWDNIYEVMRPSIREYLKEPLSKVTEAGKERVEDFVANKAPRYRVIVNNLSDADLISAHNLSDKKLELFLHERFYDVEKRVLEKGHALLTPVKGEDEEMYNERIKEYMNDVSDLKRAELATYVTHRRAIIDLLEKAIQKKEDGTYACERVIHELIMPMKKDSTEVFANEMNLWILDEKLAFHSYLSSDKPTRKAKNSEDSCPERPDILAIQVYDTPHLVSVDEKSPRLAAITIVEIKRPMRGGAQGDPLDQAIGYLRNIRRGGVKTKTGRPIISVNNAAGYCYVVCDFSKEVKDKFENYGLNLDPDELGYSGYNPVTNTYFKVMNFDRLVISARQRNQAFFDKLGLPVAHSD